MRAVGLIAAVVGLCAIPIHDPPLRAQAPDFVPGCAIPFAAIQGHGTIDHHCSIAGDLGADAANQLQNRTKNNFCATGTPAEATWTTYNKLQNNTDALPPPFTYGSHGSIPDDRSPIRAPGFHITTNGDDVHEGSLVRTVAFLLHGKYSNTGEGEAVNCGVSGVANNDIHLALVKSKPTAATNECNSVTAEISPHFRPTDWLILASLHKKGETKTAKTKDRRVGPRSPHAVHRADHAPWVAQAAPGQPRNPKCISSWEIHPVYALDVCKKKTLSGCRVNVALDWTPLHIFLRDEEE